MKNLLNYTIIIFYFILLIFIILNLVNFYHFKFNNSIINHSFLNFCETIITERYCQKIEKNAWETALFNSNQSKRINFSFIIIFYFVTYLIIFLKNEPNCIIINIIHLIFLIIQQSIIFLHILNNFLRKHVFKDQTTVQRFHWIHYF